MCYLHLPLRQIGKRRKLREELISSLGLFYGSYLLSSKKILLSKQVSLLGTTTITTKGKELPENDNDLDTIEVTFLDPRENRKKIHQSNYHRLSVNDLLSYLIELKALSERRILHLKMSNYYSLSASLITFFYSLCNYIKKFLNFYSIFDYFVEFNLHLS